MSPSKHNCQIRANTLYNFAEGNELQMLYRQARYPQQSCLLVQVARAGERGSR